MKKIVAFAFAVLVVFSAQASYLYWQVNEETDTASGINLADYGWARLVASDGNNTSYQNAQMSGGEMVVPQMFDLSTLNGSGSDYSYWIELGTYNSAGSGSFTALASSQGDSKTYAQLLSDSYISAGTLSEVPTVQVWHGGTVSVPEPTSAILMLFGAAFLGLKRKNRRIA